MYAGAVAVPLILGQALGLTQEQVIYLITADLLTCGIATLVQTLGFGPFGCRLPLVQGCTFAAVTPMILIGTASDITAIHGSIIVAGVVTVLLSPYFSRLLRFFPPVVTGTIITVIGLSLLPVAVRWAGGGNAASPEFGNAQSIGLALFVLVTVILLNSLGKGFVKNISVLGGIVIGTAVAGIFGLTDFSRVGQTNWLGIATPFHFGWPTFELVPCLVMVMVMLVVMIETTGDMLAIGEIVDKEVDEKVVSRGLMADGASTVLGGIFNAFPYSAFAQNVGLLSLTQVKSRYVVATAGLILITLGLFPKLAAIVASVPQPVLGGAGIVMFGMVAVSGIKTLAKVNYNGNSNSLIVAVSIGAGMIPVAAPNFYHHLPQELQMFLHSGITVASILAVVMNTALNGTSSTTVAHSADTEIAAD